MTDLTKKTFDFLSILTGVVVLFYLGAWAFALATGQASFEAFSKELGPVVALLVGFWVRGAAK